MSARRFGLKRGGFGEDPRGDGGAPFCPSGRVVVTEVPSVPSKQGYLPSPEQSLPTALKDSLLGSQSIHNLSDQAGPMRRRLPAAVVLLTAALALFVATEGLGSGTGSAATLPSAGFRSHGENSRLHFLIAVPDGYATSGLRYPVVYFLHGLPASPTSYQTLTWVSDALEQTGRQAILVVPQAASSTVSDPEYHDWGPGKNWETALASELTKYVDAHYRTIANRGGRAIVGYSAGGYGAAILGVHHPAEYSVIESWSGYFRPTDPTGQKTLDVGSKTDNDDASVHKQIGRASCR